MLSKELAKIDLNGLQTLVAVCDEGSFSAAAQRLGVTQSTISYSIQRLRDGFGDQLFVRQGAETVPTDMALTLACEAQVILSKLQVMSEATRKEPRDLVGTVSIACNYPQRTLMMPELVHWAQKAIPGLRLVFHEAGAWGPQILKDALSDIVIGPIPITGEAFYRRNVYSDRFVCMMDPDNPLAQGRLTLENYRTAAHVAINHNGRWEPLYLTLLRNHDVAITYAVTLPTHDNLDRLILGTQLVATVPHRLASCLSDALVYRAFPAEAKIEINMYWSVRTHASLLHRTVREAIFDISNAIDLRDLV